MIKPNISFSQWEGVDLRLGTIIEAHNAEWSKKLIQLTVDFGVEIGTRTIFTGIRQWYNAEDFSGKQALFLINLPPKPMGEFESQGMILALDTPERPVVFLFDHLGEAGSTVA